MDRLIYFLFFLLTLSLKGQVGVNTQNPETTFEVVGKPDDLNHYDGIIPPRITGDQLASKLYTSTKKGAIVFITSPPSNITEQLSNVVLPGVYFFDGREWQPLAKEADPVEYRISLIFNAESTDSLKITSTWNEPVDYYGNNNREYLVSLKSYSLGTKNYAGLKGAIIFSKMKGFTNVNFQIHRSTDSSTITGKITINITSILNDIGYYPNQIVLLHTENSTDFFPALLENNTIQISQASLDKMSTEYYTRGEVQGLARIRKPSS